MQKVDWMYHRPGCKTCAKTQAFFEENDVRVSSQVTTKEKTLKAEDALKLASQVDKLYATRGTKLHRLDLKADRPADDELTKLMLGPTGNLRAPVFRKGRSLMVGFHPEAYREIFG